MSSIRIEVAGRTTTFEAGRTVRVGRDPGCDVVLEGTTVSRSHAELRSTGAGWEVVDLGSTHGTWVNGQQVRQQPLQGTSIVRFGLTDGGTTANITVEGAPVADRPDVPPTGMPPRPAPELMATVLPNSPGAPGAPGFPGQGPGLLVRTRSGDHRFGTAAPVRIGREPGLEVTVDDAGVSRQHALVEPRPDGWWFVDRSNSGSYVEGERVTQRRLTDPVTVFLGHPTAGYELELVPIVAAGAAQASIAKKKRKKTLAIVGAAAAVLLVVGGGVAAAVLLDGDDGNGPAGPDDRAAGLTAAELDRAKQASVLILSLDESGEVVSNGSGSIISEGGLILTNAHVAKPSAPGLGSDTPDAARYEIALVGDDDDVPAAPSYVAETVVADGVLDLAIMQIVEDIDGNPVDPADLELPEPLPIADSDELRTGDEITALGFPGVAHVATTEEFERRALTVTRGVVSTFLQELPVDENRAWIDSDIRIGSGNSGGASINEAGEIVGINTQVVTEMTVGDSGQGGSFTGGSARIRPVNFAQELIDIAEDGGDPEYVSPYLEDLPDAPPPDDVPTQATVASSGWSLDGQGGCTASSSLESPQTLTGVTPPVAIYAEFEVLGLPDGTPILIRFVDEVGTEFAVIEQEWTLGAEACAAAPFEVPPGLTSVAAEFWVGDQLVVTNPVYLEP